MGRRERSKADAELERATAMRRPPPSGARAASSARTACGLLDLQRTAGNRAVHRLSTRAVIQPKLDVGPAGDRFEREADQVADEVMRFHSAVVTDVADDTKVARSLVDGVVGLEGGPLDADTEGAIQRRRGQGAPLPSALRSSMEGSFGADFSSVRVHADTAADALSRSMQARAFTVGSDIFFARGQYQPTTTAGQRVLAHELTHTVQQGSAGTLQCVPDMAQRVFAPEFFMSSIVKHYFPNGGAGYQTSQVAEKMRREVSDTGEGGQDTKYGHKTKALYHKSSGTRAGTSVSTIFTIQPTYIVAMGEHATDTSYRLHWTNRNVALWQRGNTIALNEGERIDVASTADVRDVLKQKGYTVPLQREGGLLSSAQGKAQSNQFTVEDTVNVGGNVRLYAVQHRTARYKGVWERNLRDQEDGTLASGFRTA
jgi:hypothetical protein